MSETEADAAAGQAAAKALWESLPDGAEVFVKFLGGPPRPAQRTRNGWESGDGMTGCTPWSVRVDEVWVRADVAAAVLAVGADSDQLRTRIEAVLDRWARECALTEVSERDAPAVARRVGMRQCAADIARVLSSPASEPGGKPNE